MKPVLTFSSIPVLVLGLLASHGAADPVPTPVSPVAGSVVPRVPTSVHDDSSARERVAVKATLLAGEETATAVLDKALSIIGQCWADLLLNGGSPMPADEMEHMREAGQFYIDCEGEFESFTLTGPNTGKLCISDADCSGTLNGHPLEDSHFERICFNVRFEIISIEVSED